MVICKNKNKNPASRRLMVNNTVNGKNIASINLISPPPYYVAVIFRHYIYTFPSLIFNLGKNLNIQGVLNAKKNQEPRNRNGNAC